MAKRTKKGDVFKMPLGGNKIGIGQVVIKKKHSINVIIFEPIYDDNLFQLEDVETLKILLIGQTNNVLLTTEGYWETLGNFQVNEEKILLPHYKVDTLNDGYMKTDFDGNVIGKASSEEVEVLTYKNSCSPGLLESAFKAYHKLAPWDERYDSYLYFEVSSKTEYSKNFILK